MGGEDGPWRSLTGEWPEALEFFEAVVGLHDAGIDGFALHDGGAVLSMRLWDVSSYSDETGSKTVHETLSVDMVGAEGPAAEVLKEHIGYDIIEAALDKTSLRIETLQGTLMFRFGAIRFSVPQA
jgi:hypothetical protein